MTLWHRLTTGTRQAIITGVVAGITIVLSFFLLSFVVPNPEQDALDDINNATRAQVCVLTLPVDETGRDEADVERCLRENGL